MRFCFDSKAFVENNIEPNHLALIDVQRELTWTKFEAEVNDFCDFFELNSWHNRKGPVIIYGHKQAEVVIAIYAMMKMEIPYIPIDVIFPTQRLEIIKNTANVGLIVNTSGIPLNLENTTEVMISNNTFDIVQTYNDIDTNESANVTDPLVYIIFTSGSTGEPKGVQITSEAIQSFTKWMRHDFGFTPKDVFINIALFSFDLSVYELMTFGAIGATLLLNDKDVSEQPEILLNRIEKYSGTIWVSTPSFCLSYSRIETDKRFSSINYFLFCGETLPHSLASILLNKFPKSIIYNTYGPTEATVATTQVIINQEILDLYNPLPVGYPKRDSKLLIENDEIVIIGDNVSIGYLNRPELNIEKFLLIENQRAYRTGDCGFIQDGMLFFNARTDNQVKLHGYRIELDEITAKLNDIPFIIQAETIALRRNGEVKKIVSLIQVIVEAELTNINQRIESELKKSLPMYMIPSDFKVIEKIPLNQNGKADKKEMEKLYLQRT
jgi:D-alanine--poly(phosphoribitol) ligase subunit 1